MENNDHQRIVEMSKNLKFSSTGVYNPNRLEVLEAINNVENLNTDQNEHTTTLPQTKH